MSHLLPGANAFVKRALNWRHGDEDESWRTKAVDSLIKKLRRQSDDEYHKLQLVLVRKTEDSPCITLNKSQDGRVQVSHRKMLPQVVYCRIFRWPDIQSHHELRSLPSCQHPYSGNRTGQGRVCINPYHYARVEHTAYPPVVCPRSDHGFDDVAPSPQSPYSTSSNYSQHNQGSPNYSHPNNSHFLPGSQTPNSFHTLQLNTLPGPGPNSNLPYYGGQSPVQDNNWFQNGNGSLQQFESQSPVPAYSTSDQNINNVTPMDMTQESHIGTGDLRDDSDHWCRITYAELNMKIGEPFKGSSQQVFVDGYTDPSVHSRRFSLGVLSNINRNSTIETTRCAIGKGVCLENVNGQIYVKNLSTSSIFFHSKNANVENQLNQHAVIKIEPNNRHKMFDQKVFENLVQEAYRSQDGKTYERLFSLTEHCVIKMSFVKGWGSLYQRQDVTSTPCWIEIHLTKPYALIDQYLRDAGSPSCQITSTS